MFFHKDKGFATLRTALEALRRVSSERDGKADAYVVNSDAPRTWLMYTGACCLLEELQGHSDVYTVPICS